MNGALQGSRRRAAVWQVMGRTKRSQGRSGLVMPVGPDEYAGLIELREACRDAELRRLDEEAAQLRARLQGIEDAKLAEELACFRDVLALHRRARRAQRGQR